MAREAREKMVRSAEARSMATAHSRTIFRLSASDGIDVADAGAACCCPRKDARDGSIDEPADEESSSAAVHATGRRRR
jgi:hypothetical protein